MIDISDLYVQTQVFRAIDILCDTLHNRNFKKKRNLEQRFEKRSVEKMHFGKLLDCEEIYLFASLIQLYK